MRPIFLILFIMLIASPLMAAVEMAPRGKKPVRLNDVYQLNGVPYIAIEDALDTVGLTGHWNSIKHIFRIRTRRGWAEISPASSYLNIGEEYYPLRDKPRFIDGRLRVTDNFILNQLPLLVGRPIYFNNLDPDVDSAPVVESSSLDQLFAFLLNKKVKRSGPLIRAVAIDPGHGGLDTGVLAASGYKEKDVNLKVAEKLTKQLKMKLGIPIYLSRDGDYELTLEQRLEPASKEDVDLWLLLHAQASLSPEASGVNLFVRPNSAGSVASQGKAAGQSSDTSRQLAGELAGALREAGFDVNGIYTSSLLSLGRGGLPTVKVELGYLSHPEEEKNLQDETYQEQLAQALYQGIRNYAKSKKEK
jgi:N-acetylmuramoyl-L-alanine amidase